MNHGPAMSEDIAIHARIDEPIQVIIVQHHPLHMAYELSFRRLLVTGLAPIAMPAGDGIVESQKSDMGLRQLQEALIPPVRNERVPGWIFVRVIDRAGSRFAR